MDDGNRLHSLGLLPADVLDEVVREGELNLQHHMARAAAIEARATTFAGLFFTAATALTGATLALYNAAPRHTELVAIAGLLALVLGCAGITMVTTAGPRPRMPPGNEPLNWTAARWPLPPGVTRSRHRARLSQAETLQASIEHNHGLTLRLANLQRSTVRVALAATVIAALALVLSETIATGDEAPDLPAATRISCLPAQSPRADRSVAITPGEALIACELRRQAAVQAWDAARKR